MPRRLRRRTFRTETVFTKRRTTLKNENPSRRHNTYTQNDVRQTYLRVRRECESPASDDIAKKKKETRVINVPFLDIAKLQEEKRNVGLVRRLYSLCCTFFFLPFKKPNFRPEDVMPVWLGTKKNSDTIQRHRSQVWVRDIIIL